MRSSIKSATLVFVTSLFVGISAGARAEAPDVAEEEVMADPVRCVSVSDGVLDLRVMADSSDIWSLDANASVGNSRGEVTLYVATSLSRMSIAVRFDKTTDKVKVLDAKGGETWLVPSTTGDPVTAEIPLVTGKSFEVVAMDPAPVKPGNDPFLPGHTNKAVIKQVTACPK